MGLGVSQWQWQVLLSSSMQSVATASSSRMMAAATCSCTSPPSSGPGSKRLNGGAAHLLRCRARQERQRPQGRKPRHYRLIIRTGALAGAPDLAFPDNSPQPCLQRWRPWKVLLSMVTLRTGFGSPFGRKARIAVSVLGLDGKVKVEPASTQDDCRSASASRIRSARCRCLFSTTARRCSIHRSSSNISTRWPAAARFFRRTPRRASTRCGWKRSPTAFSMPSILHRLRGTLPAARDGTCRNGSITRPARSRAGSLRSKRRRPALDSPPTVGQITLACALGYLDFRFKGEWRKDHPRLVAWLDSFAARVPSFAATAPPPG